jgi:hypothetical protein
MATKTNASYGMHQIYQWCCQDRQRNYGDFVGALEHYITGSEEDVNPLPKGVFGFSNERLQFYEDDTH